METSSIPDFAFADDAALERFLPSLDGRWSEQTREILRALGSTRLELNANWAGVADRLEAWGARLPEKAKDLWAVVAPMGRADLLDLLAVCAGIGLYAVRDPHDRRPGALTQAETLATAVGLDMTGTWSATAAGYFSRVPKARVLEAVTEAVGAEEAGRIAEMKKADMAEAAERLLDGRGWLPGVLRTAVDDAALQTVAFSEGSARPPAAA